MSMSPEEILAAAMELSEAQRETLANQLVHSLVPDDDAISDDPAVNNAWAEEVQKRLREIDEGKVEMVPWEEVEKDLGEIFGDSE